MNTASNCSRSSGDGVGSANDRIANNLHPSPLEPGDLFLDDLLGQPELRNAIDQHTARLVQRLEDRHRVAALGQFARSRQPAGAGTDHRHFLASGRSDLQGLLVAMVPGPVADIALEVANRHRQAFVAADALDLALRFLGANAAGDRGQGVIVEQAVRRVGQVALGEQLEEARDVDAHRAAGYAFGVLALKAALGFEQGDLRGQTEVDFVEVGVADQGVLLRHLLAIDLKTLLG